MKLILAVVEDESASPLMDSLVEQGFQATKLASTGGFLLRGNTTLLIGVEDDQVEPVLTTIRRISTRQKRLLPQPSPELPTSVSMPIEIESGGATVFVLNVDQFIKT